MMGVSDLDNFNLKKKREKSNKEKANYYNV